MPSPRLIDPSLSRRRFLRGAAVAGGGLVVATVAACSPTGGPAWSLGPTFDPNAGSPSPSASGAASPAASPSGSVAPSGSPAASPSASPGASLPPGWTDHDLKAQEKVRRFVGNLAGPLGLGPFLDEPLGPPTDDPEFTKVPYGNEALEPTIDGDTKVFDLTIDEMDWQIDAMMPPVKALGYNKTWPGPLLRVTEGDKVRVELHEQPRRRRPASTSTASSSTDFQQDGVPFVTQLPIMPGETFTYEFVARTTGSLMYHSHHNATDQVGRGLLGAFIVDPKDPADALRRRPYGVTQDIIWIPNDSLGGFTINGHGFPATAPIVAKQGEQDPHPLHERGDR